MNLQQRLCINIKKYKIPSIPSLVVYLLMHIDIKDKAIGGR